MSPRNLDSTLAAHVGDPAIQPCVFAELTFRSGVERAWSGVGDFVGPEGKTFSGLGELASVGAIGETTEVKAEGTTVTLSGIGDTLIDIPGSGVTPPDPPFPGQMAWSYATSIGGYSFSINPDIPVGGGVFSDAPSIWNAGLGFSGNAKFTSNHSGSVGLLNGQSPIGGRDGVVLGFSGFAMPPEIPVDAVITGIYPVVTASIDPGGSQAIQCLPSPPGDTIFPVSGTGIPGVGPNMGTLDVLVRAICENSVPGAAVIGMNMSFVGLAVYYTGTPKTKMTLLQEALGDVWVGAPAKIWFGLMAEGALVGVPYLVFSGLVDKPSIHVGLDTLAITLALENRLVNLQRANQRRYTAADQKLYYPTDMAFNWVESLNDIALRWGS